MADFGEEGIYLLPWGRILVSMACLGKERKERE
jgi:hypothetical protein